jgi:hypothetical protein
LFSFGQAETVVPAPLTGSTSSKEDLLIQLLRELLSQIRKDGGLGDRAGEVRGGARHLVYVHGIFEHQANYSQPW